MRKEVGKKVRAIKTSHITFGICSSFYPFAFVFLSTYSCLCVCVCDGPVGWVGVGD